MRVRFSDEVLADIDALEQRLAQEVSIDFAVGYVGRLFDHIAELGDFPQRNALRPALGTSVRGLVHAGRYTVAYIVDGADVFVLALFGPGQELRPLKELP